MGITLDVGYLFAGCSSKAQLLLNLDEGYLLTNAPDLKHGVAPLGRARTVATRHSRPPPLTTDVG